MNHKIQTVKLWNDMAGSPKKLPGGKNGGEWGSKRFRGSEQGGQKIEGLAAKPDNLSPIPKTQGRGRTQRL